MYQYRSRITLASTARYMVVTALAVTALLALLACTAGPGPLPAGGPTRAQAQQATATPPPAREPGATPTPSQEAAAGPERPAVAQAGGSVAPPEQPSPTASPQPQGSVGGPSPTASASVPTSTPPPTATPVVAREQPPTPSPSPAPTPDPLGEAFFLKVLSPGEETSFVAVPRATVEGMTRVDAIVSINDDLVTVDETGRFQAEVELEEGPNLVEVVASIASGEELSAVLTIFYMP